MDLALVKKANDIKGFLYSDKVVAQLEAALPKFLSADRFLRTFYTAILRNPKIMECTKESLLSCMISMSQLGLEPVMGKAAIIPYGKEAQFQPMYRGLMDLARRSADVKITAHVVYNKDLFDLELGTNERLEHKPAKGDRGEAIGVYTVWTYSGDVQTFLYMSRGEVEDIRDKYSKAYQYAVANPKNSNAQETPWVTRPTEMWKKTVIKQHAKYEPCSIEVEQAMEMDTMSELGKSQLGLGAFGFGVTNITPEKADMDAQAQFSLLVKDYPEAVVQGFLNKLVEHYAGQYTEDALKEQAVGQPSDSEAFLKGLKAFAESKAEPKTLKDRIGKLKTKGLTEWEKAEHDKLVDSFYNNSGGFTDDDLNFFMEKWKSVIGWDYTATGQPGAPVDAKGEGETGGAPEEAIPCPHEEDRMKTIEECDADGCPLGDARCGRYKTFGG